MRPTLSLLLVEDNPADVNLIRDLLSEPGPTRFVLDTESRLATAIERVRRADIDLVLLDLGLPDSNGLETFVSFHHAAPELATIVLTGNDDQEVAVAAVMAGAQDFLVKGQVRGTLLVRAMCYAMERQKSAKALRQSEEFARRVIESSSDCIKVLDLEGRLLSMSKGGKNLLEIDDLTPYVNQSWVEFWKGNDHDAAQLAVARAAHGDAAVFYGYCETAKGTPKWWEIFVSPLKDAHGNIDRLLAVSRDITARRQVEEQLRRQADELRALNEEAGRSRLAALTLMDDAVDARNRLERANQELRSEMAEHQLAKKDLASKHALLMAVLDSAHDTLVFSVDTNYCYTAFNASHRREMKRVWTADISIGMNLLDCMHSPELRALAKKSLDRAFAGEAFSEIRHQPDPAVDYELSWNPIGLHDQVIGVTVFIRDITERTRTEEALLQAREDLERRVAERTQELTKSKELLDETGRLARVGGWELDLQTKLLTWTDVTRQIHEVGPDFQPHLDDGISFYAPEAVPVISEAVRRGFEDGQSWDLELPFITAKKRRIWVRAIGHAYREDGTIVRLGGVFQDITERRLAEDEQKRDRDHLEAANKELEAFSYSVSHDLRAPLRAIDGFARILTEDHGQQLGGEGQRVADIIRAEARRMGRLIDDLLDFSRIGRRPVQPDQVDMMALTTAVFDECAAQAPGRDLRFIQQPLPPALGDPAMLRQVLTNLISNAIKFTRQKDVASIEIGGYTNGRESLYYVKDNGVGFDMKYADKLFGVFQRLHTEDQFEGTGVGLALVQRIIHRHGGRVWADGTVGHGAAFHFTLPAAMERA
jgi:PAS domain S-box-containing protein